MIQTIPLLLTLILLYGLPGRDPTAPQSESEDLTIELAQCKLETRSFAWGLGSETFTIKGRRGKRCVIRHTSELEGGYVLSECRIPISLARLTIPQNCHPGAGDYGKSCGLYSADVSKYCKVVKKGNFFFELKPKSILLSF